MRETPLPPVAAIVSFVGRLRDWTLVGDTTENRARLALDEI